MEKLSFRFAQEEDVALILHFIKDLAEYEKMLDEVVATEALLKEWIFEKEKAEVIFVMEDDTEVGFALFFHNFSTFLGRAGIYLEDLYVKPEYRGNKIGNILLEKILTEAKKIGYKHILLDTLPFLATAIEMYKKKGFYEIASYNNSPMDNLIYLKFDL